MRQPTILVIGATGTVGGPVARQLQQDGYRVRLLVRDTARAAAHLGPDFEYLQGSVEEREVVKAALNECAGIHISLQAGSHPKEIERVEYLGVMRVVELAAQLHVAHLTYVSGMFVGAEIGPAVLVDQSAKGRVEQALLQSSIPTTIFRPTYFMENLPKHLQGQRAMVLGKQPHPLHLVAASDFGRMVSRAFQVPEAAHKIFYVQGPEALTLGEALRLYCAELAPEKRVTTMPLALMSVLDTLFLGRQMRRTVQMMRVLQRYGEIGDPSEANRILGAPTTTLRAWCEQQRLHHSRGANASREEHHASASKEGAS
ncbi:MAG TPA: NAD(P)H-binding protein [Ktedonobacterales bacterium]|nr:NAD(P)H-binding protein [Ktedonobacterales bacterium]